nr:IPT/TIG domain-containing protein [Actinomycetota bacterium]
PPHATTTPKPTTNAAQAKTLASQPLRFEPNRGQADARFAFLGRGPTDLGLSPTGVSFAASPGANVAMRFVGGRADAPMAGLDPLATKASYITGPDPAAWQTGLPTYGRVQAKGVYPGVDVVYRPAPQGFEYDLMVAPGADTGIIAMTFDGAAGLILDVNGDLLVGTGAATLRQHRPVAYQDIAGHHRTVPVAYVIRGDKVDFRLGAHDVSRPLVVDPQLTYSTYLGGSGFDTQVSPGPDGSVYIAGTTRRGGFPAGPGSVLQPNSPGGLYQVGVARFDRQGRLEWATYLGPSDNATGLAVDSQGSAYVSGAMSLSEQFPTTASAARGCGFSDDYLAKLDGKGERLLYSTCVGPNGNSNGGGGSRVVLGGLGLAYVASRSQDPNFPIKNAFRDTMPAGGSGVTLSLFDTSRSGEDSLAFSTWVGGGEVRGMAATADGVVFTGIAFSVDFSTPPDFPSASTNAEMGPGACVLNPDFGGRGYVARFRAGGTGPPQLTWSACLGPVVPLAVAVDPATQHIYVGGFVFPAINDLATTPTAYRAREQVSSNDNFLAEFDPTAGGTGSLRYLTQLGGNGNDAAMPGDPSSMALTAGLDGHVFVSTASTSTDLPVRNPVTPTGPRGGPSDVWVVELDTSKSGDASLVSSSVFGGSGGEEIYNSALDPTAGDILIAGNTGSSDFPITADAAQTQGGGLLFLRLAPSPSITSVAPSAALACGGTTVDVTGRKLGIPTSVTFGGTPAANVEVVDDTHLRVVAPSRAPGTVDLSVTTSAGVASVPFTYDPAPTPQIASLTPDRGPVDGGTPVSIAGSGFDCARQVSFGGVVLDVTPSPTLTVTSPAHGRGVVDVVVLADNGGTTLSSNPASFTYQAFPALSAVLPTCGAVGGKTQVLLVGTDLAGASTVNFGQTPVPAFANPADADHQVAAESPPLDPGVYDITVVGPDATSAVVPGLTFTVPCASVPPAGPPGGSDQPVGGTNQPVQPGGTLPSSPPTGGLTSPGFVTSPGSGANLSAAGGFTNPPTPAASLGLSTTPVLPVPAPTSGGLSAQSASVPPPTPPPLASPTGVPGATSQGAAQPGIAPSRDQGPSSAPQYNMVGGRDPELSIAYQAVGTLVLLLGCAVGARAQAKTKRSRPRRAWAYR